ncbi:MAG: hypothetical protein M4579_005401 [Chaenotheca gracillima]|nr:MAG: hypothetical protein M4579_005401 [Chaenotheca gracillima]
MAFNFTLPIRIVQAIFNVIVLGLTAYVANWYNHPRTSGGSPSEVNFLIFTSIWTFFALAYLILSPWLMPKIAHPYGVLAAEAVTMIFWFAGFIALAVYISDFLYLCAGNVCSSIKAACVFGAFEWLLWSASTVLAAMQVYRSRGRGTVKPMDTNIHASV